MVPTPNRLPDASWPLLKSRLAMAGHDVPPLLGGPLFVVFIRGLFSQSIGGSGNDINVYDDGTYIVLPTSGEPMVVTLNGNTDSTRYGWNANAGKYMANLRPGQYKMRRRMHGRRYWAFGQDGSRVTVERLDADGGIMQLESGDFGIDWHPGGVNSTSSEGCLTNPNDQWKRAQRLVEATVGNDWFPIVLLSRVGDAERFI